MKATARAHANIALVKYWGKRDIPLNLPAGGSLSMTLDGLDTTTTVAFGETDTDELFVGGVDAGPKALAKALVVVDRIRALAGIDAPVSIHSENSFPTGAGLASSASGLAAVALAATHAAGLDLDVSRISALARMGSGSASRSLFGGFVEWRMGTEADGSDSHGAPLFPADHWDLRVVVAVVDGGRKPVGSTEGMEHTRRTSPYHQAYLDAVDADLVAAREAIQARDIGALGRVAQRSCLRMHADMMAGDPALIYLKPSSWEVIAAARELQAEGAPIFFTADAGPNIKIFCLPEAVEQVRSRLLDLPVVRRLISASPGGPAVVLS